jgi:hypothetical protein
MPELLDVIMALSVLSLVFYMGRWSVNLKWNKPANEPAGPPPKDSEMAVTEFEVIEGLSQFGLPEATLSALRQRIKTVEQLKHAVETIRTDSCRHAQEQMLPLAKAYVAEAKITEHADEMVKSIIFAQLVVSKGAAHPAFTSIAGQLQAIGPDLWRSLETALNQQIANELDSKIQDGPWAAASFNPTGINTKPSTWDVIEPTKTGTVRITRVSANASRTARTPICEFDPCRTEAERQFWLHVAAANIDSYVTDNHGLEGHCHGDLLTWSKFTAALEAKKPAETLVTPIAVDDVVVEPVDVEVPVALDTKSAR